MRRSAKILIVQSIVHSRPTVRHFVHGTSQYLDSFFLSPRLVKREGKRSTCVRVPYKELGEKEKEMVRDGQQYQIIFRQSKSGIEKFSWTGPEREKGENEWLLPSFLPSLVSFPRIKELDAMSKGAPCSERR